MPGQYTLGGSQATLDRPRPRPGGRSKSERSRLILTGTAAGSATVLLAWLIVLQFFGLPGESRIVARALGAPEAAARAVLIQGEDCRRLGGAGESAGAGWKPFAEEVRALTARKGDEPVVAYVSAVGISTTAGAFLLPADGSPAERATMIPLEEFLDLFKGGPGPRLLILDALQVDSDRDLGVFGNSFVDKVKDALHKDKYAKLAVLCSCDSGQASWISDADGRSAFGYFVADGLARLGGRGKVGDLLRDVRPRVAHWARQSRGAVQTPVLIGDNRPDFTLPRLTFAAPEPGVGKPRAVPDDLIGRWEERDRLEARRPYRHAPAAWRRYQDALLHAEALTRAGEDAAAKAALAVADDFARSVAARAPGAPAPPPRSLAMLARTLADNPEAAPAGKARMEAYRKAIDEALAGTGIPAPREKPGAPAPAARLGEDDLGRTPTFVEGQVPLWFAEFARRGGASDPDLKDRRLDLLRQVVAARFKAEEVAAADERVARFTRAQVDDGDARRRPAQDLAFAADEAALARGAELLAGSAEAYDQAAADAARWGRAADLVQRAGAELPYYGEWLARRDAGLDPGFEALMDRTADLAGLLDAPAAAPPARLKELADAVDAGLNHLAEEARSRGGRLAGEDEAASWREVDALLRVPMLPAPLRKSLLDRLLAAGPGRLAAEAGPVAAMGPSDEGPDPIVRDRAIGLARLELGLLKLGGLDVGDLPGDLEAARAAGKDDPSRSAEALDGFSAHARDLRAAATRTIASSTDGPDLTDEDIRRPRAAADRVARVLPTPDLARLAADPAAPLDAYHRYALLLWHGRRLLADGSTKYARRLLDDAMETIRGRTPALKAAYAEANRVDDAGLAVDGEAPAGWNGAPRTVRVAVEGRGELPQGQAAFLFRHDPAVPLKVDEPEAKPGEGTLLAVPSKGHAARKLRVKRAEVDPKKGTTAIVPQVFYRGRYFAPPEGSTDRPVGDLVEIRIAQRYLYARRPKKDEKAGRGGKVGRIGQVIIFPDRKVGDAVRHRDRKAGEVREVVLLPDLRVGEVFVGQDPKGGKLQEAYLFPDQFEHQQVRGALHPYSTLDYKLVIRNKTDERLKLVVTHGLQGQESTDDVELEPRGVTESVTGRVWSHDFPDEKPQALVISAAEGEKEGRAACKDLRVAVRKIHPREFIVAQRGFGRGEFLVFVGHTQNDPVSVPVEVVVGAEPGAAFREVNKSVKLIDPGEWQTFAFTILRPVNQITYSVSVEGVNDVWVKKFNLGDATPAKDEKEEKDEKEPKDEAPKPYAPAAADAPAKPAGLP